MNDTRRAPKSESEHARFLSSYLFSGHGEKYLSYVADRETGYQSFLADADGKLIVRRLRFPSTFTPNLVNQHLQNQHKGIVFDDRTEFLPLR